MAPGGRFAMAAAAILGLTCAVVGGPAGVVAVAWIAIVLIGSGRKVGPKIGVTALGLAAIYALAALSGFAGSDPEDIDRHWSFRLAVVAMGCAVVGITSALVWIARSRRR